MASIAKPNITVTVKDIKDTVKMSFKLKHAVFIHGAPGIGKSDMIRQIGADLGRPVYDIRLALMNPVDLRGIPMVVEGKTVWMPPCFFKHAENAILFFDEFPAAVPAVQAAAYQIILDRQIGEFKLPDSCDIVAAGNRTEDQGLNYKMAPALRNRFVHLEVEQDLNTWKDWAAHNGIHPNVIGYLNFAPDDLFKFDKTQNRGNFPTPRSWARLSDAIHLAQKEKFELSTAVVAGYVGLGTAMQFNAYQKVAGTIPNAKRVIEDGDFDIRVNEDKRDVLCAFCATLVNLAVNNKVDVDSKGKACKPGHQAVTNLMHYLEKGPFKAEYVTMAVRDFFRTQVGASYIYETARVGSPFKNLMKILNNVVNG